MVQFLAFRPWANDSFFEGGKSKSSILFVEEVKFDFQNGLEIVS